METDLFYSFRGERSSQTSGPGLQEESKDSADTQDSITCKTCGWAITSREQKIEIRGSHTHTFFNPAGVVYELACFRQAPGCYWTGEPTAEFTWFSGHVWCYALCKNCLSHLGWYFEGAGSSFFGLILKNINQPW